MLLSCKDIGKSFGINVILENISFIINDKEKVSIVGVNGAGKTTLFKIITGQMQADGGEIVFPKDGTMGYLSQVSDMNDNNTIYEELLTIFEPLIKIEKQMRNIESEMSNLSGQKLEEAMDKYGVLSHTFEQKNGYEYESRIRGIIKGLGFVEEESTQKISSFSGGQKTRVALAKLLLSQPDLLLLDEPTNHLDIESIQWLEDFLKGYSGGIILISHDRYFLDKITSKTIEIENRKAKSYEGNYSFFAHQKEVDRDIHLKHYYNQQKEIKRQEEVIKQLKSFNKEKSIKRAESREKLLAKVERVEKPSNLPSTMKIALSPNTESGNDVITSEDISKSFDGQLIFENLSFDIKKGEKTALIGPNGIGKSTLFKILLGRIPKDTGKIRLGSNVVIGYYDQEHQNISLEKTIFQEISDAYPRLTNGEIRGLLAAFIFTGDDVFKPISSLSGGERGRVALAKIMLSKANFLILDEPTNHLDIFSKEILEETLRNYTGTLLFISHDRYFINNVSTKIIDMGANITTIYHGNYDYYLGKKEQWQNDLKENTPKVNDTITKNTWNKSKEIVAEDRKQKNRLEKLEKEIEEAELAMVLIDDKLATTEVATNPDLATETYEEKMNLEEKLNNLYEDWDSLQV